MNRFGEVLAELRMDRSLTQKALAEEFHVSAGTISNYENGVHLPDIETLISFARFFDVTTDYLLGLCDDNLSPKVFREIVVPDKTAGTVISLLRRITPEDRSALSTIMDAMDFRAKLNQYSERESS